MIDPNRDPSGYTLLELLVVLGIMAAITAFAIPIAGRSIDGIMLQTDARALMTALRRAQTMAIARQETISIIAASTDTLTSSGGEPLEVPDDSTARLYETKRIDFYPDGSSSGGEIEVARGGQSLRLEVAWLVGTTRLVSPP
jgi:general secretion pathway protein H